MISLYRLDGTHIMTSDTNPLSRYAWRAATEEAVADGRSLANADLRDRDLEQAELDDADLAGADLTGAKLKGIQLRDANLTGVTVGCPIPVVPDLDRKILARIDAGDALDMSDWHTCATTHCRAGWAITLAGPDGAALEAAVGSAAAGALIYHASVGYVPDFYADDLDAMADMRAHAYA